MSARRAFITKLVLLSTLNAAISAPAYAQDSHPHKVSHHYDDVFHCVGCGNNYGGHYTSFTGADFDKMMASLQSDPFSALEIFLNTANAKYAKEGNGLSKFRLAIDYGPTIAFGNPSAMKMTVDPAGFVTMHLAFPEAAKTNPYVLLDSIIHFQVFYNLVELTTYKTVEIYGPKAHPSHHSGPLIDTHYVEMSIQSKMGIPKEVIQHNHDASNYDVSGGLSPLETMKLVANAKGGSALAVRRVAELEARNFQILKKGTTTFVPIKNLSDADRIVQLREYGALKGVQLTETRSSDAALKELQDKVDLANKKRQDILNAEAKATYQRQTQEYRANAAARELIVQGTALSEMVKANDRTGVANAMEKMLPWALMEPSEKLFWAGFVESVRHPNYENSLASSVDDYAKLIAEVNLASSYLAIGSLDAAESLLQELMESTQRGKASRLVGNCLEMLSQVHLQRNEFSKARQVLDRSAIIFQQNDSYDQLLYHKWMAIVSAMENSSPEPLAHFRNLAVSREHWESVREADLFALKIQFHQKHFDSLYYGTPKSGYRRRILQQVEGQPSDIFVRGEAGSFWLDLTTGVLHGKGNLKPGKKVHQALAALNRDFYVPRNIGTLFAELYPDDYFDINSSPLRVRQLLSRTRQWLEEMHIPASIQHIQGNYRFAIDGAFGLQIPKEREVIETPIMEWQLLKQRFSSASFFTAEQACEILKISRSSFHRLARWADKRGELASQGRGKSLRYSFVITSPGTAIRSA